MKTIFATYLDNAEAINYPIKFIVSEIPHMKVYCSDEANKEYLSKQGIDAIVIGFKITDRYSIAKAQNLCIEKIFEDKDVGFVVWNQSDIYITEEGKKIIREFCIEDNIGKTIDLKTRDIRLFHLCTANHYGCTILGREAFKTHKFIGDGAYVNGYTTKGSDDCCIHIGYLSINDFRKHINQNKITFKSPVTIPDDDESFMREIIERNMMDIVSYIEEGSIHYDILKRMGLISELERTEDLLYLHQINTQ